MIQYIDIGSDLLCYGLINVIVVSEGYVSGKIWMTYMVSWLSGRITRTRKVSGIRPPSNKLDVSFRSPHEQCSWSFLIPFIIFRLLEWVTVLNFKGKSATVRYIIAPFLHKYRTLYDVMLCIIVCYAFVIKACQLVQRLYQMVMWHDIMHIPYNSNMYLQRQGHSPGSSIIHDTQFTTEYNMHDSDTRWQCSST